jgi:hypothetical protein
MAGIAYQGSENPATPDIRFLTSLALENYAGDPPIAFPQQGETLISQKSEGTTARNSRAVVLARAVFS